MFSLIFQHINPLYLLMLNFFLFHMKIKLTTFYLIFIVVLHATEVTHPLAKDLYTNQQFFKCLCKTIFYEVKSKSH